MRNRYNEVMVAQNNDGMMRLNTYHSTSSPMLSPVEGKLTSGTITAGAEIVVVTVGIVEIIIGRAGGVEVTILGAVLVETTVTVVEDVVVTTGTTGEQGGTVIVIISVVTVPPNANDLPTHVVLAPIVIPALLITLPANVVLAPSVAAWVGVQNTSHADAPFKLTAAPAAEVSAPSGRKIYVPLPLKVRGPPMLIAPALQYTPGVYTLTGPCVVSVERLIAPSANTKVQGCAPNADAAFA